jgi:hypothetical protein
VSFTTIFAAGYSFGSAVTAATVTFTMGGSVPQVGDLMLLGWSANVSSLTVSTCSDNSTQSGSANVYNSRTPLAGSGFTGGVITCIVTRPLVSGDIITITLSTTASRRAGVCLAYRPSNLNPVLDKTGSVQNAAASPMTMSSTGTLSGTTDLGVAFEFWKGGAVLSGWANVSPTTGFTAIANPSSGGTTTKVEVAGVHNPNIGSSSSITPQCTFTSITAGCGEFLTFTDNVVVPKQPSQITVTRLVGAGA